MRLWDEDLATVHAKIRAAECRQIRRSHGPMPGEGLAGWLLRVAEVEHERGVAGALARAGCKWQGFPNLADSIPALAAAYRVDADALRSASYEYAVKKRGACHGFGGQRLGSTALTLQFGRICPECLREGGVLRQVWDLRLYTECPRHRASLIDHCPHCAHRIAWRRAKPGLCDHCGGAYADAQHVAARSDILPLADDIERVVSGEEPRLLPGLFQVIKPDIRIHALLETYAALGRAVLRSYDLPSPLFAEGDVTESRRILGAAAVLLDGTWGPLHHYFSAVYVPPKGSQRLQIRKMFPWVYRALFIRTRKREDVAYDGALALIQAEFAKHIASSHPELTRSLNIKAHVLRRVMEIGDYVALHKAAHDLGIKGKSLLRAADQLGIEIMRIRWSKGTRYVRTKDQERIRAELVAHPDIVFSRRALDFAAGLAKAKGRAVRTGRHRKRHPAQGSILKELAQKLKPVLDGRSFPRHDACAGLKASLRLPVLALVERLGLAPLTITRWIEDGLFEEFEADRGIARSFVTVGAYAAFESALAAKVDPAGSARRKVLALNRRNLGVLRNFGVTTRTLLPALLKGQLGAIYVDSNRCGLARILIDRKRFNVWLNQWRETRHPGYYDHRTATRRLGVGVKDVVRHLRRKGFIRGLKAKGNKGGDYYHIGDFDRFTREFVQAADLRPKRPFRSTSAKVRWLKQVLRSHGVLPIIGPEIDGCEVAYYRRSDVNEAVLAAAENSWRRRSSVSKPQSRRKRSDPARCQIESVRMKTRSALRRGLYRS